MVVLEEVFKPLESCFRSRMAAAKKLRNAKGQATECSQCGNPLSDHTSCGFPAVLFHLRQLFRNFLRFHVTFNEVFAPLYPLAELIPIRRHWLP